MDGSYLIYRPWPYSTTFGKPINLPLNRTKWYMAWAEDPKYLAAYSKASAVRVWCWICVEDIVLFSMIQKHAQMLVSQIPWGITCPRIILFLLQKKDGHCRFCLSPVGRRSISIWSCYVFVRFLIHQHKTMTQKPGSFEALNFYISTLYGYTRLVLVLQGI